MTTRHTVSTMAGLIDAIAAGSFNSQDLGPEVVKIRLWDGRLVIGSYYRLEEGDPIPTIHEYEADVILDDKALQPLIERLLEAGEVFVTDTGSHDMVCTLRWSIREAA